MINRFITYLRETKGELKHVAWPTRKQSLVFTAIIIVISLLTAGYLGVFDFVFTTLLDVFII